MFSCSAREHKASLESFLLALSAAAAAASFSRRSVDVFVCFNGEAEKDEEKNDDVEETNRRIISGGASGRHTRAIRSRWLCY